MTTPPPPPANLPAGVIVKPVSLYTNQAAMLVLNTLGGEKLTRAVYSERQLEAVMTDFWFNHFNVLVSKTPIHAVLADYEHNAIRSHVFGKFADMLAATAQHPAMQVYLDNYVSSGSALNENYARELMELHTLGVDGGYTQQDVIEVARVFTGWGLVPPVSGAVRPVALRVQAATVQNVGTFAFNPDRHDKGSKTILGRTFPADTGMAEGLAVLRMLSRHPSTANFVATKLVRHFVADEPPPKLVAEVARVFRETDGDLRQVTRALFMSNAFYDQANFRSKFKRPFEFVASALRVTNADVGARSQGLVTQLRTFKHQPYGEPAPTGYSTKADEWVSAGALLGRMNFALDLVSGRVAGVTVAPAPAWNEPPDLAATALLDRILVGAMSDHLHPIIAAELAQQASPRTSPSARALALTLGSPDFQKY